MITGKTDKDLWFDNTMAKPPFIDNSSPYSVLVFFATNEGNYYCGQLNYEARRWDAIPDVKRNSFNDIIVKKWMYIPDAI